MNKAEIKLQR